MENCVPAYENSFAATLQIKTNVVDSFLHILPLL